jgi:hypothetical protein
MSFSSAEIESVLAIDVGTVHTRAYLFEITDDKFHFIAQGITRTTAEAPTKDIGEGILLAIKNLEMITERVIIGPDGRFVIPSLPTGAGVDGMIATISVGPAIKTICAGLLAEVSLESAEHLAKTSYTRVSDRLFITDSRKIDTQIDSVLKIMPDVIILTGGSENGATRSIQKMLETIGITCSILPQELRPEILFAGNGALKENVKSSIEVHAPVIYTSNIRPNPETERMDPAQLSLAEIVTRVKYRQISGAYELNQMVSNRLMLTASSFGRMIRFLGNVYNSQNGVLGIDIGTSNTTVAIGKSGGLTMQVAHCGTEKDSFIETMFKIKPQDLQMWINYSLSDEYIQEYLMNKAVFPASIPTSNEDLAVEYALTRYRIKQAINSTGKNYPHLNLLYKEGLNSGFEPVILSGTTLNGAPSLAHSLMIILDGLQPIGVTTMVLDNNNVLPVLGACGQLVPALPVEVLESGVMQNLCTVISPVSNRKPGTTILYAHLVLDSNEEIDLEIQQGNLTLLPLAQGQTAKMYIEPVNNADLGLGSPGKGGSFRISAGIMGLVFDARGRPIVTPTDTLERQEMLNRWLLSLRV